MKPLINLAIDCLVIFITTDIQYTANEPVELLVLKLFLIEIL
jgi:hypothetical protein